MEDTHSSEPSPLPHLQQRETETRTPYEAEDSTEDNDDASLSFSVSDSAASSPEKSVSDTKAFEEMSATTNDGVLPCPDQCNSSPQDGNAHVENSLEGEHLTQLHARQNANLSQISGHPLNPSNSPSNTAQSAAKVMGKNSTKKKEKYRKEADSKLLLKKGIDVVNSEIQVKETSKLHRFLSS